MSETQVCTRDATGLVWLQDPKRDGEFDQNQIQAGPKLGPPHSMSILWYKKISVHSQPIYVNSRISPACCSFPNSKPLAYRLTLRKKIKVGTAHCIAVDGAHDPCMHAKRSTAQLLPPRAPGRPLARPEGTARGRLVSATSINCSEALLLVLEVREHVPRLLPGGAA
jgi:hypothetical protein